MKEAVKFDRNFQSLAKEADESLANHKALELEIEHLLRAVVSQDIMAIVQNPSVIDSSNLQTELERTKERFENCIIKKENEYGKLWNDWYKKCEECQYDEISYDKAYNDTQQKIEPLQAQLGDQKGKSKDTPYVSNTLDPLWSPTGRLFDIKGKIIASSESESQSDCSNGDNACTSNPSEPTRKRFPNSTFFLGRLSKFVYGYGDLQWGNILTTRVYFVEGLEHNLFSVGQFYDSDLKVAFRRNTCFVKNLEGVDLLKGNQTINLYTIKLHEMASTSPICLMDRATSTKSWLWHQRLSHLNFDIINKLAKNDLVTNLLKFKYSKEHLCPSYEQRKSKALPYKPKPVPKSKQRLPLLHMDLCGPMRVKSINGKRVYNRRTKKIMETMNVTFDELSAMAFEQHTSKSRLQDMTFVHISSGLALTYAPLTITSHKPIERELGLLFEAMYVDYIGGQPSVAPRTTPAAPAPQVLQTLNASTTTVDFALTPTNSSSQAPNTLTLHRMLTSYNY
ncbi:retrovirus-related pol polyprotein from transposon TNT 1-94, partial [Tanacetum coccineum]